MLFGDQDEPASAACDGVRQAPGQVVVVGASVLAKVSRPMVATLAMDSACQVPLALENHMLDEVPERVGTCLRGELAYDHAMHYWGTGLSRWSTEGLGRSRQVRASL
jgi:hypothetical protein